MLPDCYRTEPHQTTQGDVTLTSNLAVTLGANTVSGNVTVNSNGLGNTVIKANKIYKAELTGDWSEIKTSEPQAWYDPT